MAILGTIIPVAGVLFVTPIAIVFGALALYGGSRGLGVATLIIVVINLIVSPTFWLNIAAGSTIEDASANRFLTWFNAIGVVVMFALVARSARK